MRFPVPERIKIKSVVIFATTIFLVQQLEQTEIVFSMLCAAFFVLFALAFNAGGGLLYPSGAWIAFNGLVTAIIGLTYKCFLGEPGQTHLTEPNRTMSVYCVGMAACGLAAALSHRLRPRRGLLSNLISGVTLRKAAIGCLFLGILLQYAGGTDYSDAGSLSSAIRQLNQFLRMAVILATTYQIVSSRGKSSTNWIVYAAGAWMFLFGVVGFSKEGMFLPFVTWLIPAIALGFDFPKKQILGGALVVWFLLYYMVPFSQYGRRSRLEGGTYDKAAIVGYLSNLQETRRLYLQSYEELDIDATPHFFNGNQGLFDREQMLTMDDALIQVTDQGSVYGVLPTVQSFANVVPRLIWKNKPAVFIGNDYGREIGVISEDDESTGISFSPIGDAYHQATWFGVLVIFPGVIFLYFFLADSIAGSVRDSPWPLLPIAISTHFAPEGLLGGTIYLATYGMLALAMVALLSRYVLPQVVTFVTGRERSRVRPTLEFRPRLRVPRLPQPPAPGTSSPNP